MNLTYNQKCAIEELNNNLQIIACAGSGKTEVITRRILNLFQKKRTIKAENVIAFTFTEKAAESMKNRINNILSSNCIDIHIDDMFIGTIHSFCYMILKKYCPEYENFKILDSVKNFLFLKRFYNECGMCELDLSFNQFNTKLFLECIEKLINDYDNFSKWEIKVQIAFNKYKQFLYSKGYFNFPFLIHETIQQLKKRPEIIEKYKYLICDEYQDIDDLQETIIKFFYNNNSNICVVGDDDQSIYRI